MRRSEWIVVVMFLFIMLMITACGTKAGNTNGSSTAPNGTSSPIVDEPASDESKELRVRFYDDPAGFDPHNIFRIENEVIAYNIYSGLTTYHHETGEIVPDLAESWETSDNKTWTFHLRKGVKWQKGYGDFTSADVMYSFNRVMDPDFASPFASRFDEIISLEAPDDYTIVIELVEPNGNFLHSVTNHNQGQIVKKEVVEEFGDQFLFNPVGTGPYYLERIEVNSEIVLARFDEYFLGQAPIERIVWPIIKDETTSTIALQNGEIDVIMRSNREENLAILEQAGFKMNSIINRGVSNFMFNLERPILSDVRVRQAWAHAIDTSAVNAALAPKLQGDVYNIIPDWMDVYSDKIPRYEYNPEKAKQLIADAGFADGVVIKLLAASSTGVTPQYELFQEYLGAVGIQLEFELVDAPTFNARRNSGEFDVAARSIPATNPDMVLFSFLHPDNKSPGGLNGARYDNPEVTANLVAGRAEMDPSKRLKFYEEAQIQYMTDLPYWPAHGINIFWPGKENVTGININYLSLVNFFYVDIE